MQLNTVSRFLFDLALRMILNIAAAAPVFQLRMTIKITLSHRRHPRYTPHGGSRARVLARFQCEIEKIILFCVEKRCLIR